MCCSVCTTPCGRCAGRREADGAQVGGGLAAVLPIRPHRRPAVFRGVGRRGRGRRATAVRSHHNPPCASLMHPLCILLVHPLSILLVHPLCILLVHPLCILLMHLPCASLVHPLCIPHAHLPCEQPPQPLASTPRGSCDTLCCPIVSVFDRSRRLNERLNAAPHRAAACRYFLQPNKFPTLFMFVYW